MQVHDWIICSLVTVDHRVGVESNNQVVSLLGTFLKEVQMADMEQVELQKGAKLITWEFLKESSCFNQTRTCRRGFFPNSILFLIDNPEHSLAAFLNHSL